MNLGKGAQAFSLLQHGVIRARDGGPECKSPKNEGGWGMGTGLIGLHMKSVLPGESFTISGNWLELGGTARPQDVNALE